MTNFVQQFVQCEPSDIPFTNLADLSSYVDMMDLYFFLLSFFFCNSILIIHVHIWYFIFRVLYSVGVTVPNLNL